MHADSTDPTIPHSNLSSDHELDIDLAARYRGPVLISAPPDRALVIARRIARRGHGEAAPDVLICDPVSGDDVIAAIENTERRCASTRAGAILLLREVHVLNRQGQSALFEWLGQREYASMAGGPHVFASSSANLLDHVACGAFDHRLLYRLNRIHIVEARVSPHSRSCA